MSQRILLVKRFLVAGGNVGFQRQTVVYHIFRVGTQSKAVIIVPLDGTFFRVVVTRNICTDFVVTVGVVYVVVLGQCILRGIVPPVKVAVTQIGLQPILVIQISRVGIGRYQIIIVFGTVHHLQVAFCQLRNRPLG